jgi:hypothetical protein
LSRAPACEIFVVVGHPNLVKIKAKSALLRQETVLLNRKGLSNQEIAAQLSISTRTVQRHLNRFLEIDARYPAELNAETVQVMRAQAREDVEASQRRILKRVEHLMTLQPDSVAEECKIADSIFRGSDAFIRGSERVAEMFGLNAPRDVPVTNNNLQVNVTGASEVAVLRDLARFKELQLGSTREG